MKRGHFITFEGGEGVGKSTQASRLTEALQARGEAIILTREPGGTPGAEAVRSLVLGNEARWDPRAECLLFAAARADHVTHVIRPALARGEWVVCDRFVDSSRAYQGGEGGLHDEDIVAAHQIGSGGLMPDCTILLHASQAALTARLLARDGDQSDRIGGRSIAYHRSVADRFRKIANAEAERFILIDAEGSPDDVHRRIMKALHHVIEG